jgi:uracil-DNA glycosylase family protein
LRAAETACRRCPLYRDATQVVPGEGPAPARLMLVGEQPGDQEDIRGRPFVGPAGRVLDRAIAEAGIERGEVFVTNAVKHFKWEPRGKRRLHKKPSAYEIDRCRWWSDIERAIVQPALTVALGATAAASLLGRSVTIGKWLRARRPGLAGDTRYCRVIQVKRTERCEPRMSASDPGCVHTTKTRRSHSTRFRLRGGVRFLQEFG